MRKVFQECTVVELVYKFDEKSTASVGKGELTAKMSFKLFWGSYIYIYIISGHQSQSHITPCSHMHMWGNY